MICSGIIQLVNYRKWTETLGYDREWKIQQLQSILYYTIINEVKNIDGISFQCRSDYYLIITPFDTKLNNFLSKLITIIKKISPVPIKIYIVCGLNPYIAQDIASKRIHSIEINSYKIEIINKGFNKIGVIHLDVNNITLLTLKNNVYISYMKVMDLYSKLMNVLSKYKVIVQYLGGDNIAVIFNPNYLNDIIKSLLQFKDIKFGVGISSNPRHSFKLATKALDQIRVNRNRVYLILKE